MCECANDAPRMRAVRAATSVTADDPALVREAITELLTTLMTINALDSHDIISAMFTATPDLRSAFPATAEVPRRQTCAPSMSSPSNVQ